MSRAIIFGINGQDGYYLEKLLLAKQISVTGVSRSPGPWQQGSITDQSLVTALVRELQPDYIFHLAARSKTGHELLYEHQDTIVNGSLHVLEAVFNYSPSTRVFITGSGLQFCNNGDPIHENAPFEARDAYSLARIQSVYAARYYRSKGVKAYTGYLFHHDSPLRSAGHLNRKIADAAIAAAAGHPVHLTVGDITVEKEFGFAGDIAAGIFQLLNQDQFFEACIGTGKAYSVEQWLDICFGMMGKNWKDYVQLNNQYTADFRRMLSDPSLLQSTGWQPSTDIRELAAMMLKPAPAR
jgi:GDPmannose 4,6-dehydratase